MREREDRLADNEKRFHLVGTRSAECWGEEDGSGGRGWGDVSGDQIVKILVNGGWFSWEI